MQREDKIPVGSIFFSLNFSDFKWKPTIPPFLDRNGAKTIPFGAAHTYMAYLREYHPTPPPTPHLLAGKHKATLPTEPFFRLVDLSVLEKDSASLHELSKMFSEHAGNVGRTQA